MRNTLKIIAVFLILGLLIMVGEEAVYAACSSDKVTATLTNFYNVIQKLEISKNGGATYFTVFDNNTDEVDLVAVSGQNVGSVLGTNSNIPAGRYNYSRVTITNSRIIFSMSCSESGHSDGTLTIGESGGDYEPSQGYPIIVEDTIDLTVNPGGTTNAVMNFDAESSYAGSTFVHEGGTTYSPEDFVFDPQVTVTD